MSIPAILTGSAGRAIDDVMRVRGFSSAASYTLHGVAEGRTLAQEATNVFNLLGARANHEGLKATINGARPGLQKALGTGQPHVSGTMHAKLAEIESARSVLAGATDTTEQVLRFGRHGANAADELTGVIDQTLPQLHDAARRTAATRVAIGALGIGGAIAGVRAITNGGDDGQIIAPGPLHAPGAPDLPSNRTYA